MKVHIQLVACKYGNHAWAIMDEYGMVVDLYPTPKECQNKINNLKKQFKSLEQI